jgi:ABC-type Fe3+/spermidine/putrescine transport system ATPase subunit
MSDEVVVMSEGCIQQIDSPEGAYYKPSNEFVANFLGIANLFRGEVKQGSDPYIELSGGDRIPLGMGPCSPSRGDVIAMLRPEQLAIVDPGSAGAVPVKVLERVFLGESIRYVMRTERGSTFTVQSSDLKRNVAIGDQVGLTWDPKGVWLLPV